MADCDLISISPLWTNKKEFKQQTQNRYSIYNIKRQKVKEIAGMYKQ